jgi:hypothetical protein
MFKIYMNSQLQCKFFSRSFLAKERCQKLETIKYFEFCRKIVCMCVCIFGWHITTWLNVDHWVDTELISLHSYSLFALIFFVDLCSLPRQILGWFLQVGHICFFLNLCQLSIYGCVSVFFSSV